MTPDQFKAWFDGFCDGIADAPTPEQWEKVKAKVGALGSPVLRIDRPDLDRQRGIYDPNIAIGSARIAAGKFGPASHETRVVDPVSGRDLGCSD